jgi:hypothetical protein|tara:strand:+ start:33 stop:209 length:177 start_codon:yes stop_codon:yes gene_type:complete
MREIIKETKNEIDNYLKEQNSQDIRLQRAQNNLAFLLKEFERLIDDFYSDNSEKISNQ